MLAEIVLGLLSNIWSPNLKPRVPRRLRRAYKMAYAEAIQSGCFDPTRLELVLEQHDASLKTLTREYHEIAHESFAAKLPYRDFLDAASGRKSNSNRRRPPRR